MDCIRVTTIGYYHRDGDMRVTPGLLPKILNRECLKPLREDFFNLNIEVPDSGQGENNMVSFLDYISQTKCLEDAQPDFVTNKQILTALTGNKPFTIHAIHLKGTIFSFKSGEVRYQDTKNFGGAFEHFCTRTRNDEQLETDDTVRKAVFKAEIPRGNTQFYRVLYSGQIDAIDNEVDRKHYELKIMSQGLNEYFWKEKSCKFYWQSVFGNAPVLIIGSRSGQYSTQTTNNYPPYSLYKVEELKRDRIPSMAARCRKIPGRFGPAPPWKISEGEDNALYFLDLVKDNVINDGDCFSFTRTDENPDWDVKRDEESAAQFRDVVLQYLDR
ncbi:Decapping nuclease [Caenorhabditis elegans]|uniref:Decapping nuclease n=1 Tax=Caenorhabditis elegans TaxID=6239 RepID=Q9U2B5_CAEEL|nr:Decapping nuclease [Caenorhabditis elegans]CAB60386.1 Decapping nuclease [Caenorhabditis elegans]|eukprot:NP_493055.1 Uncharacterized protein CELE_Y47H10A.4 [Caenorhabditis elegans]